jgi:hypothetical protein
MDLGMSLNCPLTTKVREYKCGNNGGNKTIAGQGIVAIGKFDWANLPQQLSHIAGSPVNML